MELQKRSRNGSERAAKNVSVPNGAQSLFGNYEGRCGEGFWLWPRRRVPSIPAAGCKERANAGHGQKTRRPEGFRAKGRLASLLLGHRPLAGMLPRRASPSGLLPDNRPPANFKAGSKTPERGSEFGNANPRSRDSEMEWGSRKFSK